MATEQLKQEKAQSAHPDALHADEAHHKEEVGAHGSDAHHSEGIHISLKPDIIGQVGPLPITNTMVGSLLGSVLLIVILVGLTRKLRLVPTKPQMVFESLVQGMYDYVRNTLENDKVTAWAFPLILSLFIFILFFNLVKFIPGTESVLFDGVHLFKPIHSDFNMTIALSLVSVIFIQFVGMFSLGFFKYWSKFINFKKPATIPIGIIELISEAAKLVSLSFRLFGNVLVGGILLLILAQASHFIFPVPVMLFEIFVAFLQAGIFSILTLFYIKMAIDEPH